MQKEPNDGYYYSESEFNILGHRMLWQGLNDRAIEVFKVMVKEFPESALAYDNLGEAYFKKGETKLAIENYEKSLEIFPENRNAIEILKIIRRQK